jgi:protein phosphatase
MRTSLEDEVEHSWGYGTEQRLRDDNQDCHGVFELAEYTLGIVCDGMGGHVGGAQASSLAVRTVYDTLRTLSTLPPAEALSEAIQKANLAIYEAARRNHRLTGMGTTVVAAIIQRDVAVVGHVGDSRAYLLRQGQVQLLTRDHTMVNLFVDAELLSPEDAATHPEAHVLSRSLGVERQVDVEISEPFQLEPGDVIFLCSDGVHGVVTDWELANVDWRAPHAGVQQILHIVDTRDGDDNASAVALLLGTTVEEVPETPVPEFRALDQSGQLAPQGATVVPIDEQEATEQGDDQVGTPRGAGYVVYEDHPIIEKEEPIVVAPPPGSLAPALAQTSPNAPQQVQALPANVETAPAAPPGKPVSAVPKVAVTQRRRFASLVPVALATAALLVAAAVVVVLVLPEDGGAETIDGGPDVLTPLNPVQPGKAKPALPTPNVVASTEPSGSTCPPDGMLFAPKLPPPPRRLPWRPAECTQPPPGGPEQFRAVEAGRRHDCRESLQAVQGGMKKSIDHCRLFQTAWLCFDESHQRELESARSKTFADAKHQLPHFEGTPEQVSESLTKEQKRLPTWFRPAVDGIEFRMQTWNEDTQMAHYVTDLLGELKVADVFAKDLHLEAVMAAGMACQPDSERTPAMVDAWARRVFVVTKALERDRTGRLMNQHRPELIPVIRDLLKTAITPQPDADGKLRTIPDAVTEAYEVGMGTRPEPTGKPAPKPVGEQVVKEPEIPEDDGGIRVNN